MTTSSALTALYDVNLLAHVAAGAVGLGAMFVPMLAKKGGRLHRRSGWVFVIAMAIVSVTGWGIGLSWMIDPVAVRPPSKPLDAAGLERYVTSLRTAGVFFTAIGVLVASSVWQGLVALWQRRTKIEWGNRVDRAFAWSTIVAGIALLAVGLPTLNPVFLGFGVLAVVGAAGDLRFYRQTTRPKNAWLLRHLQAMLGGATAATTAFAVQVVGRTLAETGNDAWMLIAWGLPPALGIVVTRAWSQRVTRGRVHTAT